MILFIIFASVNNKDMKIRVRYFILIILLVFIGGYYIGCKFPFFGLSYIISNESVNPGTHFGNVINIFLCIGSFGAVIVALFKAEIQGLFKSVDLKFGFEYKNASEILAEGSLESPKAKLYYNNLKITNNGNINALNCEIQIDEVQFKKGQDVYETAIHIEKPKLSFGSDHITFIPANGGYKRIKLFEIASSQDPKGNIKNNFKIGDNVISCSHGGTWTIKCCINVENALPYTIICEVHWDGVWHDRINEMQIESKIK